MPYYLSQFGSTDLPLLEARQAFGTGMPGAQMMPLVTGGAYRLHGTERRPRPFHTLSATGDIDGDTWDAVQADVDALFALQGTYAKLWRTEKDDTTTRYWTYAELLGVDAENTADYVLYQPVALSFAVFTPYWYSEVATSHLITDLFDSSDGDLPTLGAEGDTDDGSTTLYLLNSGNLTTTRVRFTITSGTGTISMVTLTNVTTGHVLIWDPTVAAPGDLTTGQELVIDAGAERITRNGVNAYGQLTEPVDKERWFELAPGENVVTLAWDDSATDDSSTIDIEFDPTWA